MAIGMVVPDQGGHDLEAYVNVRACRAFCFTYAPDEDAIGGLTKSFTSRTTRLPRCSA